MVPPMFRFGVWTMYRYVAPPIVWQRLFVAVKVIMGAGMDSLVVDVVEVNVVMGAGMHLLVSDFAVSNSPERRAMENDGGWRHR